MYPHGVKFLIEGLGLESLTPEGYDKVIPLIKPAAERLAKAGSQAIILMGTSLTFYKGAAFNQQLTDSIKSATGLPATHHEHGRDRRLEDRGSQAAGRLHRL